MRDLSRRAGVPGVIALILLASVAVGQAAGHRAPVHAPAPASGTAPLPIAMGTHEHAAPPTIHTTGDAHLSLGAARRRPCVTEFDAAR